jgi:hypothetical protein
MGAPRPWFGRGLGAWIYRSGTLFFKDARVCDA